MKRGGRCRLTGPQRRRSTSKVQGHGPRFGSSRTHRGLGSTEPEPRLPPPPAAVAAVSAKPSFRHPRRRLTTWPQQLLEPRRAPENEYRQSGTRETALEVAVAVKPERRSWKPKPRQRWSLKRPEKRFGGSLSRHPLRYRKPHPLSPHSPVERVPGVTATLPPPAPAGTAGPRGPQLSPAAVAARSRGSCPCMGAVAGRARASPYRKTSSTRLLFGCGSRLLWVHPESARGFITQ
ncbi:serine/arginine repetitive matrix protein 1-like [Pteronotus mesoamericanus]|uniref:serine/arginine repetitive matrix protein 1-like n=1 Tax=Pteronotus mesoamericanus TaxID=1884717 RepID=UPI0023ED3E4E|nr:serine/arginine repetitive matrix protein 1-like [Pteronotus parnellii mesoamericanus]